ncbi:MAG TPA: UDP-glucuronic acid decarboxylase family protein [Streptosporangiaceae bacterium]
MRVLVTGGAGFLGSHLCDALTARGDAVVCVDDLSSGRAENVGQLLGVPGFEFVEADITTGLDLAGPFGAVAHLASPASPPEYLRRPLETLAVGSTGTRNALAIAHRDGARFLLASTSEVYGDPLLHPQPEEYWGNVNPIGPRSVYDEAKRFAEALTTAYRSARGLNAGIVRIFNTYGPRMSAGDGRIVTNFVTQALTGQPLTVYGDGSQTRSFCYVDDLIRGLVAMIDSAEPGPVNLGNPEEFTVGDFARLVLSVTGSSSPIEHLPLPQDDPTRRRPVITRAAERLGWQLQIGVREGVSRTVEWLRSRPGELAGAASPRPAGAQ